MRQAVGQLLVFAAVAVWAPGARAQTPDHSADMPMPAVIATLKAHEVVEQILDQQHELALSTAQHEELNALHKAVRDERALYESTGRTRPPEKRPVWITTPEQALAKAFTILTPQQRHQSLMLFERSARKQ